MPHYDRSWERYILKNGKPGRKIILESRPYTPINHCQNCGAFGPPRKVRFRGDVFNWNSDGPMSFATTIKDVLCMSCWNKVRPRVKMERAARENRSLINKLKRIIGK